MNKIEALELELAARKMVKGAGLNWWSVIRNSVSKRPYISTPHFTDPIEDYELALGIIEGKPVWKGDKLFSKFNGRIYEITTMPNDLLNWSWNPLELPLDVVKNFANYYHGATKILAEACRKAPKELK